MKSLRAFSWVELLRVAWWCWLISGLFFFGLGGAIYCLERGVFEGELSWDVACVMLKGVFVGWLWFSNPLVRVVAVTAAIWLFFKVVVCFCRGVEYGGTG